MTNLCVPTNQWNRNVSDENLHSTGRSRYLQFGIRLLVFYWISAEIIRFHFVRNTNIAHQPVHTVFPTISFNIPFPLLNFGADIKTFPFFSLSLAHFNNSIILFAWRAVHTAPMVWCRIRLNLIMPICTRFACATRCVWHIIHLPSTQCRYHIYAFITRSSKYCVLFNRRMITVWK